MGEVALPVGDRDGDRDGDGGPGAWSFPEALPAAHRVTTGGHPWLPCAFFLPVATKEMMCPKCRVNSKLQAVNIYTPGQYRLPL